MNEKNLRRLRLRYYGRVQGVGFRYVAQFAADAEGATGWARNEYDGSVTVELQGTAAQLEKVMQRIAANRYACIEHTESRELTPVPKERSFGIRF